MKQIITKKQKPIALEMHKGCHGCKASCQFNGLVTTRVKNMSSKDITYGCNTSRKRNEIIHKLI